MPAMVRNTQILVAANITLATEIWPYDVLKVSSRVREFMEAVAKSALLPGSEGWLLAGGVRK